MIFSTPRNEILESRLRGPQGPPCYEKLPFDVPEDLTLWAKALPHPKNPTTTPQTVAHRGYSSAYPENTMPAFCAAIHEAGAHALECDIHLSRDGVIVLNHDIDLRRCFGRTEKVRDLDFKELQKLKTIKAPHVPMPSLQELLEFLAEEENSKVWLIIDVKLHDDAETLLKALAKLLDYIPSPHNPWARRVLLGCWKPPYMALARQYLPTIPLAHIGLTPVYAHDHVLPLAPHTSLNLALASLIRLSEVQKHELADTAVFAWTVNDPAWMRWCVENASIVGQKLGGVDAVVTDDPKLFNQIAAMAGEEREAVDAVAPRVGMAKWVRLWGVGMLMGTVSRVLRVVGWYGKVTVIKSQQDEEKEAEGSR